MDKKGLKLLYHSKLLTSAVAALCTGLVASSVSQASDIKIYQAATAGNITLTLMIDTSGSMTDSNSYDGTSYTRLQRVQNAMVDLLQGSNTVTKLSDDKVIGLSSFYNSSAGYIILPAQPLNTPNVIYKGISYATQRDALLKAVADFKGTGSTPTANAYAEVAAYMMGKITGTVKWYGCGSSGSTNQYDCQSLLTTTPSISNYSTSSPSNGTVYYYMQTGSGRSKVTTYYYKSVSSTGSGFAYSADNTKIIDKTLYEMPGPIRAQVNNTGTNTNKSCSAQGIYMLTDGEPNGSSVTTAKELMKTALTSGYSSALTCSGTLFNAANASYSSQSAWECISDFSQLLLNNTTAGNVSSTPMNPLGLKIRTAVVGFGNDYNNMTSYDGTDLSVEANRLLNLNKMLFGANTANYKTRISDITSALFNSDVKKAAAWGIYGQGGWYSGSSSQDVVNSVNNFIKILSSDIPAVTTGSPTIPKDSLNPAVLQKEAYFPQFQPTPDKKFQLWAGNLKKYNVVNGVLKDRDGTNIIESTGTIKANYDLWSEAITNTNINADDSTIGSKKFALKGGAWSKLLLKMNSDNSDSQRKLVTNRFYNSSTKTFDNSSGDLKKISRASLLAGDYQTDSYRGYLMALLGYPITKIDAENPANITLTSLNAMTTELRQIGAVMHSSPLLLTNSGKITYLDGKIDTTDRDDYVLFGTTQGLLHVVKAGKNDADSEGGKEVFTFVPNEMVENQPAAFLKNDVTDGGIDSLYYGIDAPWTSYTEYVLDSNREGLTVGAGYQSETGKQMVYGGLRMGGRSYYALNLQDMNNPKLMFQISPKDQKVYSNATTTSYPELQYMGGSWSKPAIAWVNWKEKNSQGTFQTKRKRVMFVGGGYDEGYESETYNPSISKGAGIYMFDADNGKLLWWASANTNSVTASSGVEKMYSPNLQYSVVSEIRTEDRNGDGLVDHLYFGDLGGQLFRIDLDNAAATNSSFAKLPKLLLNLHNGGTGPRFYEMPAFSIYDYNGVTFAVISIGSGDRSTPLASKTSGNYDAVYNIYDRDVAARNLYQSNYEYQDSTVISTSQLGEITNNNWNTYDAGAIALLSSKRGWFYRYNGSQTKVFFTPIVLNHRLFVSTFDGSKDGLSGDCGAGVKGESFLTQFCMPFGQCSQSILTAENSHVECAPGADCSQGAGIQGTTVVDDGKENQNNNDDDPPPPENRNTTNNKNYCVNMGNRGVTTIGGIIASNSSKMCLIPQRWYVR
ncbi:PilC/PilY family type IV pilus protein [Acinetobacter sp. X9]